MLILNVFVLRQILCALNAFNIEARHLRDVYELSAQHCRPWSMSSIEITCEDWDQFLGDPGFEKSFQLFFEDEYACLGFDTTSLTKKFCLNEESPLSIHLFAEGLCRQASSLLMKSSMSTFNLSGICIRGAVQRDDHRSASPGRVPTKWSHLREISRSKADSNKSSKKL